MPKLVGTVTGLKEISPYSFWIRVNSGQPVPGIDSLIQVDYQSGEKKFRIYGVITEVVTAWDGMITTGYQEEAYFEGTFSGTPIYLCQVAVTRAQTWRDEDLVTITPFLPPPAGEKVFLIDPEETDAALGFDVIKKEKREIPVGILSNGEVAYLDLKYLLGDNGAHINISGQSGVAAKTSYATFLLWMLQNYAEKNALESTLARELKNSRSVIFNVKGESLLFLDYWNAEWKAQENKRQGQEWKEMFSRLGVEPRPFQNVKVYVPPKDHRGTPRISRSRKGALAYGWDILDIVELNLVSLMFDVEEVSANPNFLLAVTVIEDLLRARYDKLLADAEKELKEKCYQERLKIRTEGLAPSSLIRVYLEATGEEPGLILENFGLPNSFRDFVEMFKISEGEKGATSSLVEELRKEQLEDRTIAAVARRLRTARRTGIDLLWRKIEKKCYGSIEKIPEPDYHLQWNHPGSTTVIDISKLHQRVQAFVVGAVLKEIMFLKEKDELPEPVFIYLDELNKYAPRTGGGALAGIFRDVAERGRSFRVVLIGAEQTASQVDYRVITQAATTIVGRQKQAELSKEEYAHLQGALREKASSLLPGEVIIDQPFLRIPITVSFPLTPWATSEENREQRFSEEQRQTDSSPEEQLEELLP